MSRLNPSPDARTRYDESNGAIRSWFNPGFAGAPAVGDYSNSAISDEFLQANADLFNLEGIDLILTGEKEGSSQTTFKYEQYYQGIPVYGSWLQVTLDKASHLVVSSVNRVDYGVRDMHVDTKPGVTPEQALERVTDRYGRIFQDLIHSVPQLLIFRQRLAWRIDLDTRNPAVNLELLIDAEDGGFLEVYDRRRFYSSCPARVFWPDPVTSSRNPDLHWGSPEAVLNEELTGVVLENLEEPVRSLYSLNGKWVRIADLEHPQVKNPRVRAGFEFSAKDRRLLSVMAYYYLDRLIEWLQSLGIPAFADSMKDPIRVDAHGLGRADNSHFVVPVAGVPYIAFGEGGVPDASDPGVIVHEFGHALHYYLLGRLAGPDPWEEGFNDFLSCVFRDRFNRHGFDRANPFPWDNNPTSGWDPERRCDMGFRFDDPDFDRFRLHKKGTVLASALWDIYLEMGGKSVEADERLAAAGEVTTTCLDMLIAVGGGGPVFDLANGLISSDSSRTGGRHGMVIREAFRKRGLWS